MEKSITFEKNIYPDRVEKIYHLINNEDIADLAFTRLIRVFGFERDGGFNGLDKGWVRVSKRNEKKSLYFQVNWSLDNDGNHKANMCFTKFLK